MSKVYAPKPCAWQREEVQCTDTKQTFCVLFRVVSLIQVNKLGRDPGYFTFLSDGFAFQTGTGTRGVFHPKTNSSQPPPRPIERNRPPKAKRPWLPSPSPHDIKARPLSPYRHFSSPTHSLSFHIGRPPPRAPRCAYTARWITGGLKGWWSIPEVFYFYFLLYTYFPQYFTHYLPRESGAPLVVVSPRPQATTPDSCLGSPLCLCTCSLCCFTERKHSEVWVTPHGWVRCRLWGVR
ncbi:hypothetical protein EDB85DRAFT_2007249 [Lactarius pseudohatsudake]|nr:hypothetical protein EDB85DRAFT_2007249 [Lactarius pseudohatsudake]